MNFEIVTLSKSGGREYNEDVYGHWSNGRFMACLVADGAGGHGGGDVAASTARSSILGGYARAPSLDRTFLKQLLEQANLDVVARQAEGGKLAAMRTTAVLAVLDTHEQALMWAHSGDSRAYLFRDGAIVARTVDHSLVQQMVAGGMLDEEGARLHPQRNMLLSALGSVSDPLEIDVSGRIRLQTGDVLLLCSDGVWEVLGDRLLLESLHAASGPRQWAELLDAQVHSRGKVNHDNYTALILWTNDSDDQTTRLLNA